MIFDPGPRPALNEFDCESLEGFPHRVFVPRFKRTGGTTQFALHWLYEQRGEDAASFRLIVVDNWLVVGFERLEDAVVFKLTHGDVA